MKKIVAILLVLTMGISLLTACGGDSKSSTSKKNNGGSSNSNAAGSTAIVDKSGDMAFVLGEHAKASIDLGGLYVTDSMIDKGIQTPGNAQRFASAFERASNGETITVAYVGSEITRGDGASSAEKSYASVVTKWLQDTFPSATINTINKGFRHGDSSVACAVATTEILPNIPDIVIIETAIYDSDSYDNEYYESLVRELLESDAEPAVLTLATCNSNYNSDTTSQASIAFKYKIPFINYASVLEANISNSTWKWTDVAESTSTVVPRDTGHAFLAHLVTSYFSRVIDGMGESTYAKYTVPADTTTKCRYEKCKFIPVDDVTRECENGKFSIATLKNNTDPFFKSAYYTKEGDKATFKITAKTITVILYQASNDDMGTYDIAVDGSELKAVSCGTDGNGDDTYTQLSTEALFQSNTSEEHTITFTVNEKKSTGEDDIVYGGFAIIGFITT